MKKNNFVDTSLVVFSHELRAYTNQPLSYIYITVFLMLAGTFTFTIGSFFEIAEASLAFSFFRWHPWLYAFLAPAIGMRIWAREYESGTMELIHAQPIDTEAVVCGKYLAALTIMLTALLLTFPVVLTVSYLGDPDLGEVASGYLGSIFLAASFLSLSTYFSASTRSPVSAYLVSAFVCVFLVLLGSSQVEKELLSTFPRARNIVDLISSLSVTEHFRGFRQGLIQFESIVFYVSIIICCLLATAGLINKHKL